jgi:protein-disulfide isomerase
LTILAGPGQQLLPVGTWVGDSTARVKIIEFADYECPYCRKFHDSYALTKKAIGSDVALLYIHFPLSMHRFAGPAIRASDCAGAQGQFPRFSELLFEKQDSFGLKPWVEFAKEAGIADLPAFKRCIDDQRVTPKTQAGIAAGEKLKLEGTPTIIINGWRYWVNPFDSLTDIVRASLRAVSK